MHWLTTDGSQQQTKCEGSKGNHVDGEGLTSSGVLVSLRSMVDGVDFKGCRESQDPPSLYFPVLHPIAASQMAPENPWMCG